MSTPTIYLRYRHAGRSGYGILDDGLVKPIRGDLFGPLEQTGEALPVANVELLTPCEPPKVLAVGRNYRSHLGERAAPSRPEIFYKPTTCLIGSGEAIRFPEGAANVHSEGELVIVIGRRVKNATPEEARKAIFGVTCGNDVSERNWQNGPDRDLQWWRAKGADTFGPLGPWIVTGIDYGNLMLETRLNGEVVQRQSTADLIFDCPTIVSWISQAVTLLPGDVVYTGTPGTTKPMKPGDIVEVEIEGIGVLRNPVQASGA